MSSVLLVGVDCSECSDRAVAYASEQAKRSNASVIVAHVIEWSPFSFSTVEENAERHKRREEEIRRAQSEVIEPMVDRLRSEGLEVEGIVRHGHVADTLNALAGENGVTNIILGRHGSSLLRAHAFGSVASHILQVAGCAVTVVP
jgi:nucleotide-binding universal stress UspA family protein